MKRPRPRLVALAFLLAAAVLARPASADTPATSQVVLAVAKVGGLGGEAFVSSLRIVNPNTQTAHVALTFLPQSPIDGSFSATGDNSGRSAVNVTVSAGATLAIEDVVGTTFGGAAPFGVPAGAIQVDSDVPVSVQSRTFVANARSATGVAGTYGFTIPAQSAAETIGLGDTAYLPYVSSAPSTSAGFRTNFIMANVGRSSGAPIASVLHVKLLRGDGSVVGERDYHLGKLSAAQQTNIASTFGLSSNDTNLTIAATVTSGGPVAVGLSIIDNAISSLNYAPPSKSWEPDGDYGLVVDDAYGLGGQLAATNGEPTYLSATLVFTGCSGGASVAYVMQAFTFADPGLVNTTFTKNGDRSWTFNGSSSEASWTGGVTFGRDSRASGTIAYTRKTGSDGGACAGLSRTVNFTAAQ